MMNVVWTKQCIILCDVNNCKSCIWIARWNVWYSQCFLLPLTPKNFGLEWDLNRDLSNACAVLHQLSCQANWELVILWIGYKLVDDDYRSTCKLYDFRTWKSCIWTVSNVLLLQYLYSSFLAALSKTLFFRRWWEHQNAIIFQWNIWT